LPISRTPHRPSTFTTTDVLPHIFLHFLFFQKAHRLLPATIKQPPKALPHHCRTFASPLPQPLFLPLPPFPSPFVVAMGNMFAKQQKINCIMVGPKGVGKTTILYTLLLNESNKTWTATNAYNYEVIQRTSRMNRRTYKYDMHMWDLAGDDELRSLWPYYYNAIENANVLIYVVNANNRKQTRACRPEFKRLVHDTKFRNAYKMVIVNIHKPADENKMDAAEVRLALGIDRLDQTCQVEVHEMNASNLSQVTSITQKICQHFTKKMYGNKK
jgi:small GTP-binding protein